MNKKKLVALGLIVVLLLTAIGGTLAYFTDTDEATNVMTVGNVDIELRESGTINSKLLYDEDYREALEEYELMPGMTVEKNVWVDNVGSQAAYIRVVITVPTDLTPTWAANLKDKWKITEVNNTWIFESLKAVSGETSTDRILESVTLKADLDQDVVASKYEIPINVYAIQAVGFNSAADALNALEAQTGVYVAASQDELNAAIAADGTEAVTVLVPAGEYTLPSLVNKDVTITGTKDTVIDTVTSMPNTNGAELTFKGVTVNFKEGGQYGTNGFTHSKKVVYENCTINGTQFLYSEAEFINCTFNVEGDAYAVWTYGSPKATFTDCTFNTSGKAILVYTEAAHTATITVDGCTFNCDGAGYSKAAVEVGESAYGKANYTLIINKSTADEGFTINKSTSNLWGNKNDMPADRLKVVLNGNEQNITPPAVVETITTAQGLRDVLENVTDADSGNSVINIEADIDLTSETWTPYNVDGYNGAGIIIINGNNHTITGLNAPLFAGGFAGTSGIVINDLTIADSKIVSTNIQGSGAFIECIDSMQTITLNNCHLLNSTVTGSRTGGLIGWNSGYDNTNNGAVMTTVTIKDCTVVNCEITGNGTVGGIVGHAGANAWTVNNITNCKVENTKLTSNDDSYRVGAIVGTANTGEVVITNCTSTGNTIVQNDSGTVIVRPEGQSELYGRFVPGTTGKLTIDDVEIN